VYNNYTTCSSSIYIILKNTYLYYYDVRILTITAFIVTYSRYTRYNITTPGFGITTPHAYRTTYRARLSSAYTCRFASALLPPLGYRGLFDRCWMRARHTTISIGFFCVYPLSAFSSRFVKYILQIFVLT
jgi:hypothetical protein